MKKSNYPYVISAFLRYKKERKKTDSKQLTFEQKLNVMRSLNFKLK